VEVGNRAARRVESGLGGMSERYDTRLPPGRSATRLSVPSDERNEHATARGATKRWSRVPGCVARFSLLILLMTCTAGCFEAPPEYSEPTLVPPVIYPDQSKPSTTQLYQPTGAEANFTIVFRADDGDRPLKIKLISRASLSPTERPIADVDLTPDPRAFADQLDPPRSVDLPWQWRLGLENPFGCHVVTAIITDVDNFEGLVGTKDPFTAARVSWYVWLRDENAPVDENVPPVTCFVPNGAGVTR
jgi:hypothetical protein